jgi:hypothetical protein
LDQEPPSALVKEPTTGRAKAPEANKKAARTKASPKAAKSKPETNVVEWGEQAAPPKKAKSTTKPDVVHTNEALHAQLLEGSGDVDGSSDEGIVEMANPGLLADMLSSTDDATEATSINAQATGFVGSVITDSKRKASIAVESNARDFVSNVVGTGRKNSVQAAAQPVVE